MDGIPIQRLLKGEDIAQILNVSRTQAYRLMREEIPVVRFGGSVRVRVSDLENYVTTHIQGGDHNEQS